MQNIKGLLAINVVSPLGIPVASNVNAVAAAASTPVSSTSM